jgi:hypothetical protein
MFTITRTKAAVRPKKLVVATIVCLGCFFAIAIQQVPGCPFCLAPPQTWAEILDDADVVVVAEFVNLKTYDLESRAETRFRIRVVQKNPGGKKNAGMLRPGQVFTYRDYVDGSPGQLFLLTGRLMELSVGPVTTFAADDATPGPISTVSQTASSASEGAAEEWSAARRMLKPLFLIPELVAWDSPSPVSRQAVEYIFNAPSNQLPQRLRLPYYIAFLEHADTEISIDAWAEFARSQYTDVKCVSDQLSRPKLRQWISNSQTTPERLGMYGMMLGLCGDQSDAEFLREQMGVPGSDDFRFGAEGLMGGFLLLSGVNGLELLERSRIRPATASTDDVVSVVYAMRFIWSYEPELVPAARLRQSMRLVLDWDDLQETAVIDLARWQDWDAAVRLIELYDESAPDRESLRASIREYMRLCAKAEPSESTLIAAEFLAETHDVTTASGNAEFTAPR